MTYIFHIKASFILEKPQNRGMDCFPFRPFLHSVLWSNAEVGWIVCVGMCLSSGAKTSQNTGDIIAKGTPYLTPACVCPYVKIDIIFSPKHKREDFWYVSW